MDDPPELIAVAHLCPFCTRVGSKGIPGLADRDIASTQEVFLCKGCGAIAFLQLPQMSTRYRLIDLEKFQVHESAMHPRVVSATRARFQHDKYETFIWLQLPLWRVCAAAGIYRYSEQYTCSISADKFAYKCNSYSLSHPETPYTLIDLLDGDLAVPVLPSALEDYIVYVLLEDGKGAIEKAQFIGHTDKLYHRWEQACRKRLGVVFSSNVNGNATHFPIKDGDSDDE